MYDLQTGLDHLDGREGDDAAVPGSREHLLAAARADGAAPAVLAALASIPDGHCHPMLVELWPRPCAAAAD